MFWMLHVLIMLFSSKEPSEENSRIEKKQKILQHREMLFISWEMKMKMSVRERDIRSILGYDSLLFHLFFCAFSIYDDMKRGMGLKRFHEAHPRVA